MPLPLIIPAISTVVGSYFADKGAKQQAATAQQHQQLTENARQDSMGAVGNEGISDISNWLFPGLLPTRKDPTTNFSGLSEAVLARINGKTGARDPQAEAGADLFRAEGGPTEAGQPYVVGEQGPEVMVPEQDGSVVPNPGAPGGPPPEVPGMAPGGPQMPPTGGPEGAQGAAPGGAIDPQTLEQVIQLLTAILGNIQGGAGAPEGAIPPGAPPEGGMAGIEPRAQGGNVNQGDPYLVGEAGPKR